jgi:hypothetical protein
LKGAFHALGGVLAATMAAYNIAAWCYRREAHLGINSVVYSLAVIWEIKQTAHHLERCAPSNPESRIPNPDVIDLLFDGHRFHEFRAPRVASTQTHGTGCTYASAIAASLALGRNLPDAAASAQQYVAGAIAHAPGLGHGRGPLNHFWRQPT